MGIPPSAVSNSAACTRSRRWYGPWRCAWRRHRRPSAGPPASAEGSSSVSRSSRLGSFACSSPLRGRPRLRKLRLRCLRFRRRLLPRLDRRRIPRDVLDKMAIHRPRNSASHADGWPDGSRQTRKRPAKTSPRSEAGRHTLQPHSRHSLPSTSRRSISARVVGMSNIRLGYEGARQRRAVLLRPPYLAAEVGQNELLDPHQFKEPRRRARNARPAGQARSQASGTTLR